MKFMHRLFTLLLRENIECLRIVHRSVSPKDGQHTPRQGHPHNRNRRGYTRSVAAEMQLGQQKAKSRRLHGSFNGHGSGSRFIESGETRHHVPNNTTEQVQQEDWNLQLEASVDDGFRYLGNGTGHQQTRGNNTHHGRDGENSFDKFGKQLIGCHTDGNRCQDNL